MCVLVQAVKVQTEPSVLQKQLDQVTGLKIALVIQVNSLNSQVALLESQILKGQLSIQGSKVL